LTGELPAPGDRLLSSNYPAGSSFRLGSGVPVRGSRRLPLAGDPPDRMRAGERPRPVVDL